MQSYSTYNEQSMNFSNINGVKDIKEYNMNYHKKNDNLGLGELNIRNNNVKKRILFNENNMMNVATYLKNKRKKRKNKTLKEKLQYMLKKSKSLKNIVKKKKRKKKSIKKKVKKKSIKKKKYLNKKKSIKKKK